MQVKTDWSVTIYPDGPDEDAATVYFRSAEEKVKFINSEKKMCHNWEMAYRGSSGATRVEAKIELHKKRVSHAYKQGFAPAMKDRLQWYFAPNYSDPDSPKSYA